MLYIGIDLGTSAMKLLLMDAHGRIKNVVSKEYPLEIPVSEQGPGMGGAMLAMVACGEYTTVKACCEQLCATASTVDPAPELVAKYEARYQQFRKIYPALKGLFPEIH